MDESGAIVTMAVLVNHVEDRRGRKRFYVLMRRYVLICPVALSLLDVCRIDVSGIDVCKAGNIVDRIFGLGRCPFLGRSYV